MTDLAAPTPTNDFTEPPTTPKFFTIDDDTFYCAAHLPAGVAQDIARMQKQELADQIDTVVGIMDLVLLPESAQVLAHRMRDPLKPVTSEQLGRILRWIVEEYADRPTIPPPSSPNGQVPIGLNLTDGASVAT